MPTRTRRRPVKPAPKSRPPRTPRARRRRPGALTGLLVVLAAGAVVAASLSLKSAPATLVSERTVTVTKGVIQTVVSGSGNLAPARQVDVDFATSGKITKVYTKAGAHVSKGELLARLDNRSQKVDVAKAQAALVDAEDALTKAQDAEASGTTSTAATADANAATATTANAATVDGDATATTATAAAGAARAATVAYRAQETPTPTEAPRGDAMPTPSATATPRATAAPRASATPSPTATAPSGGSRSGGGSSGGAASSGGGDSSSSSGGGSTQSVESAQADVDSAQLALDDAQDALDDTVLRAPMAGTVASVSAGVGDTAGSTSGAGGGDNASASSSSSTAFIVLAQLSRLKLEVGLSESDIGKVEVGQSATVTINAASGEDVAGHVTDVGVLASESSSGQTSSAVSYPVTITLDQTTDGIKAGMSATADIVVSRVSGLSVPSQALRGSTVTVERDGKRTTQRVQTGIVGDSATQVVSGLNAGDKVIVTSTSTASGRTASGQSSTQQTGRFGGAGGFGGGGIGGGGATFRGGGGGGGGFAAPPGGPGG